MKKVQDMSRKGLEILREQTYRSLKEGRVPLEERGDVQTAIIEADNRIAAAQRKDAD